MVELRTAQKLFLEKAEQTRKNGNKKGLLIFATGLGKSLSALSDALRVAKKTEKILVLAHNQDLLKQLSVDFKKLDKKRKIGFMYKVKKDLGANVIFGNVRTIKNYLNSFKKDEFAYIIVDESHHTSAKTYKTILEYFTPKFLLGMTATPTRNDEKDIFPLYDDNLILNVEEKEAMNKGWLRPYKIVAFWDRWCDYGDINHYSTNEGLYKYDIKEVGKKYIVPERIKGIFDIIKNGKEEMSFKGIGDKKGVYFSVRCVVAKRYCDEFNKMGIKSVYIDGKTSPIQREKILKDFTEDKYQLLFNVGLIGEGFHIPKVDLVIIDRPTDSHILWNQQKGRQIFNIEGQEDNSEGLLIDFVGNSKGNFKKYTYNSERTSCKNKKDFIQLVENSIDVPCEFEEEVIEKIINEENIKRTRIKESELISEYKRLKKVFGRAVKTKEMNTFGKFHHTTYVYRFGSWSKFLKLISERKYLEEDKNINIKELKIVYKKLKNKYGRVQLRHMQKQKEYPISQEYFYRNFKTWNNFIRFMGDIPHRNLEFKDYKNEFFRLEKILGKIPTREEFNSLSILSAWNLRKFNLTWNNFLSKLGFPKSLHKFKERELIELYLKLSNKIKKIPNMVEFQKETKISYIPIKRIFGNWKKFYNLCNKQKQKNNIKITSTYKPKTIIIPTKQNRKGLKKNYEGLHKEEYKSKVDKIDIREKIISKINDGDNVLLLESPDLSALKEIEKQNKKPNKIIIPNNKEFKKLVNAIQNYKTDLNIEIVNTSILQYLVDSEEKFDFLWLDYCGAFSYYMKDLDILFSKKFNNIKLVLTYNLFDPAKEDENYYFTRVIDYVLSKNESNKIRLMNDVSYRYKKNMYNIGFNIQKIN